MKTRILMRYHRSVEDHMTALINLIGDENVHVYRNITKNLFSVKSKGIVVCHTDYINLKDVTYNVQPKGRDKVRRTGIKNVHAYVKGKPTFISAKQDYMRIYYNPKVCNTFVLESTYKPIYSSKFFIGSINKICYLLGT